MSSYFRYLILFIFVSASFAKEIPSHTQYKNDLLTLMAIDSEINKDYLTSATFYEELSKTTNNFEDTKKTIRSYFLAQKYNKVRELTKENIHKFPLQEEYFLQEYILSTVILDNYEDALKHAKMLIQKYKTAKNYLIVGDIYLLMKSYRHAKQYYESSYHLKQDLKTLLALSDVLYSYLDQKETAISYLENYNEKYGCEKEVCYRLIQYMQSKNDVKKMIVLLEKMYEKFHNEFDKEKLLMVQKYMLQIYEQVDMDKAILFLEKTNIDSKKLLNFYSIKKEYKKALKLVKNEYNTTQDDSLLGQIAILEYEMAKDKSRVLQQVIDNFEKSLKVKENVNYENYYGYLLIEYDIDISKGLELAKRALEKQPNNYAYMDSVAWGYYKQKECKKAYKYMKKVVEQVGLSNEEIKLHFEKIKDCNDIR